jgi:hypothetical protein
VWITCYEEAHCNADNTEIVRDSWKLLVSYNTGVMLRLFVMLVFVRLPGCVKGVVLKCEPSLPEASNW